MSGKSISFSSSNHQLCDHRYIHNVVKGEGIYLWYNYLNQYDMTKLEGTILTGSQEYKLNLRLDKRGIKEGMIKEN